MLGISSLAAMPNLLFHRTGALVTMKGQGNIRPITITNSYAPHRGYRKQKRKTYWKEIDDTFRRIPKKHIHIWATDNNGQIACDENNDREIMGMHTWADKTDDMNGKSMKKILKKHKMFVTNTKFIPKKHDKRNLITWKSPDGNTWKQIDYIAISENQKNWVSNIINHGPANDNQENQHRIIEARMQVKYKAKEENKNQHINFNLGGLQDDRKKLAEVIKEMDIETICNGKKKEKLQGKMGKTRQIFESENKGDIP